MPKYQRMWIVLNNTGKTIYYFVLWGILSLASVKLKELVLSRLAQNGFAEIKTPFLSFYEVHNTGAAFNLFTDKANALIIAAVVCTIIITAIVLAKTSKLTQSMVSAMSLLSAGMTLNTFERIHNGFVVDYVYFTFFKDFPVFNVPDIMIVIGALMLVLSILTNHRTE